MIVIPDSFSALAEYADEAAEKVTPDSNSSVANRPPDGVDIENHASHDPNVVILKSFEDVTRRSSSSGRTPKLSPSSEITDPFCSLSLSPVLPNLPSPFEAEDDNMSFLNSCLEQHSQDTALLAHFRHVVWKQLFPHDRGQDDSHRLECGMTLSVDFIEREAAHFPPVCLTNLYLMPWY